MAATGQDAGQGSVQVNDTYRKKRRKFKDPSKRARGFCSYFQGKQHQQVTCSSVALSSDWST